jgi:hypothetical protein
LTPPGWLLSRWTCALVPPPPWRAWRRCSEPRGPSHAYVFANKRATRIKVLVYDGFGIWLAARLLS